MKINVILLLLSVIWGGSFIAVQIMLQAMDPALGTLLRVGLSFVWAKIALVVMKKNTKIPMSEIWKVWIVGMFSLGIPYYLIFMAGQRISAGLSGILNGTVPLWALILSYYFLKGDEKLTWNKITGMLVSSVGLLIVFYPKITFSGHSSEVWGCIIMLITTLCYAIGAIFTRKLLKNNKKVPFHGNFLHQHSMSIVFLAIMFWAFGQTPNWSLILQPKTLLAILHISLLSTALGYFMFYYIIDKAGPIKATAVTYIIPISAILLDFIFIGTKPHLNELFGAAFIIGGVALIEMSKKRETANSAKHDTLPEPPEPVAATVPTDSQS
jgi:drug/metabolite transporter (DMT)-like permease